MTPDRNKILSLDSLKIGFITGKKRFFLYPPVNASAKEGELVAVIGRNGIGKSTLLRTISGLQTPLGGIIQINGKSINSYTGVQLARQIGYISTEVVKAGDMRVYDLVVLGRFPYTNWFGRIDSTNHEAIVKAIEMAGLTDFRNRYIAELSDGERQRAMIAMVLARDTPVIVMDEPTAFLDVSARFEIFHLLRDLARNRKKTIVFSTHDLHSAVNQADKVWLMLEKEVIEGAPEDLILKKSFYYLFENSPVKFNPLDESFTGETASRGRIFVSGRGRKKYWTEKALSRAGFEVSEKATDGFVKAPSAGETGWVFQKGKHSLEFKSIYDLLNCLSEYEDQST